MADRPTRILVCDDSDTLRFSITRLLDRIYNFEVVANARNGEQAIECSRMLKPEVVIMDIEMPSMNGIEAVIRIKNELPETVVIMFSSTDDDSNIFRSLAAGADGYCTKRSAKNLPSIIRETQYSGPGSTDRRGVSRLARSLSF